MNRRHFLATLPALSLLALPCAPREPSLYPVQHFRTPNGTQATLLWDGQQHWRVDCNGHTRTYVHPSAWHGLDAEFYAMQEAAQVMAWGLIYESRTIA